MPYKHIELETHPFLDLGILPNAKGMILGSFPIYEMTLPDNPVKRKMREEKESINFFYSNPRNSFWDLYESYIDDIGDRTQANILQSIRKNKICFADTVRTCRRAKWNSSSKSYDQSFSPNDSGLRDHSFNIDGVNHAITRGVNVILCTSKGVLKQLQERILPQARNYQGLDEKLTLEENESFRNQFKDQDFNTQSGTIQVYNVADKKVLCIAIPSPGSAQRKLGAFGYVNGDRKMFLNQYMKLAFGRLKKYKD